MNEISEEALAERHRQLESLQARLDDARNLAKAAEGQLEIANHNVALLSAAIDNLKATPL